MQQTLLLLEPPVFYMTVNFLDCIYCTHAYYMNMSLILDVLTVYSVYFKVLYLAVFVNNEQSFQASDIK